VTEASDTDRKVVDPISLAALILSIPGGALRLLAAFLTLIGILEYGNVKFDPPTPRHMRRRSIPVE
jgi:hypothetical protein